MKKLLIPFTFALVAQCVYAGEEFIALKRTGGTTTTTTTTTTTLGIGVLRSGGNIYRPIPRSGPVQDLTTPDRYRAVVYRPTQHFYTKDNVVSYRYTANDLSRLRSVYGGTYLGPHGAQFVPMEYDTPPSSTVRTYAAVSSRPQPGVAMVPKTAKLSEAPVSRIQVAKAR
jgi:hypothetical protein